MRGATRLTPTPSMIVALVALSVALTGGAYAVTKAATNSVTSASIQDGQVRSLDINTNAVSKLKIASNSVDSPRVVDGSLGVNDLSAAAVAALQGAKGDPGAQGPAGPSDVFAMRRASFTNLPSPGFTTLASTAVPAGAYLAIGKVVLDNDDATPGEHQCEIREASSPTTLDESAQQLTANGTDGQQKLFTVIAATTLAGPGTLQFLCAPNAGNSTTDAARVSFAAVKVGTVTTTP